MFLEILCSSDLRSKLRKVRKKLIVWEKKQSFFYMGFGFVIILFVSIGKLGSFFFHPVIFRKRFCLCLLIKRGKHYFLRIYHWIRKNKNIYFQSGLVNLDKSEFLKSEGKAICKL